MEGWGREGISALSWELGWVLGWVASNWGREGNTWGVSWGREGKGCELNCEPSGRGNLDLFRLFD